MQSEDHSYSRLMDPCERWASRKLPLILALIFLTAFAVRVLYFCQQSASPFFQQHRWDQSDMNFFHEWAKNIAAGDWWTNQALHPRHGWHDIIAKEYFARHPEELRELIALAPQKDPVETLWNKWSGGLVFHQEPLYPYLMGITYKVFGEAIQWVFVWQMLFGLLGVFLIYRIASRHFGLLSGLLAAGIAGIYGPYLYYEMLLLRSSLMSFFALLIVDLADQASQTNTSWKWFFLGLGAGCALLLSSTFLIFIVGALLAVIVLNRKSPKDVARYAGALALGALVMLLPLLVRNLHVGAPMFSMSSVGPITFINSNAEDYSPDTGFAMSAHAAKIMGESGGHFFKAAFAAISTHPDVMSYLGLLIRKFDRIWYWYEIPNNANFYCFAKFAPILGYLLTFRFVAPLAILGLGFSVLQRRFIRLWPLALMIVANVMIMTGFYVLSRFRIPLAVVLIPFAAFGLVNLISLAAARHYNRLGLSLLVLALVIFWTSRPLPEGVPLIRVNDYMSVFDGNFIPRVKDAVGKEQWGEAAQVMRESLDCEPPAVKELSSRHLARNRDQAELARFFASVHQSYAIALGKLGQEAAALNEEGRARDLQASAAAFYK